MKRIPRLRAWDLTLTSEFWPHDAIREAGGYQDRGEGGRLFPTGLLVRGPGLSIHGHFPGLERWFSS